MGGQIQEIADALSEIKTAQDALVNSQIETVEQSLSKAQNTLEGFQHKVRGWDDWMQYIDEDLLERHCDYAHLRDAVIHINKKTS